MPTNDKLLARFGRVFESGQFSEDIDFINICLSARLSPADVRSALWQELGLHPEEAISFLCH